MYRSITFILILSLSLSFILVQSESNYVNVKGKKQKEYEPDDIRSMLDNFNETLRTQLKLHLGNQHNQCDTCQHFANIAQDTLKTFEPFFDKIINKTEDLCKVLVDKPLVKKCQTEVEKAEFYYHWLADTVTPFTLCQYMHLC
jgi:hypothetical protein|uniref:Saposin B-type domain-containing protein n=1 Tax=viral metagenome TaxID=1070528 RepID=A0A6C0E9F3_9ZZZZ